MSQAKIPTGPGHIEKDFHGMGPAHTVCFVPENDEGRSMRCVHKKTINEHVHSVIIKIKNNATRMTNDALQCEMRDGKEKETEKI